MRKNRERRRMREEEEMAEKMAEERGQEDQLALSVRYLLASVVYLQDYLAH